MLKTTGIVEAKTTGTNSAAGTSAAGSTTSSTAGTSAAAGTTTKVVNPKNNAFNPFSSNITISKRRVNPYLFSTWIGFLAYMLIGSTNVGTHSTQAHVEEIIEGINVGIQKLPTLILGFIDAHPMIALSLLIYLGAAIFAVVAYVFLLMIAAIPNCKTKRKFAAIHRKLTRVINVIGSKPVSSNTSTIVKK